MVVIPKSEYDSLKQGDPLKASANTVGEGAKENTVTNVTNDGGLVLVNSSSKAEKNRDRESADNEADSKGKESGKSAQKTSSSKKGSDDSLTSKMSGKDGYQAGRFARSKGKVAAISRNQRNNTEEGKKNDEKSNPDVGLTPEEKKGLVNEFGRPIVKGRRLLPPTLKRKRGEEDEEGQVVDRKRQREAVLQQTIDDKLAKLQGSLPPSLFTRGNLTTRPIARVLQAPIFKPEPLQPMDVDREEEGERVRPADVPPQPMDEDEYREEQMPSAKRPSEALPLIAYRRGVKRGQMNEEDVEEKPPEKRRWLGERSHTDDDVTYPDESEGDVRAITYEEKPPIAHQRRTPKRLQYVDEDDYSDKRVRYDYGERQVPALSYERRGQKRLTVGEDDMGALKQIKRRGEKRKALMYQEDEPKKIYISRKRQREDKDISSERKRQRRMVEKRPYPFEETDGPSPARRRRYEDDNDYELW
jgi:hypothetical protein